MQKSLSIRAAWYGLIATVILTPILLLAPWLGMKAHTLLLEKALLEEHHDVEMLRQNVEHEIERILSLLTNESDAVAHALGNGDGEPHLKKLIDSTLVREKAFHGAYLFRPDGSLRTASDRSLKTENITPRHLLDHYFKDRSFNTAAPELTQPLRGQPHLTPPIDHEGEMKFIVSVPVGAAQPFDGVLLAIVNTELLWEKAGLTSEPDAVIYIADREGNLLNIISADEGYRRDEARPDRAVVRALIDKGTTEEATAHTGLTGKEVFSVATKVGMVDWTIVSEIPQKTVMRPIHTVVWGTAVIALAVVGLFGWLGIWLARGMLRSVTDLSDTFERAQSGNYAEPHTTSHITEIRRLEEGFNRMIRDIHQRETDLRKNEAETHAIIATVGEGVVTIDATSRITFVNDELCTIFGYAVKELLGKNLRMLMPQKYRDAHDAGLKRYMETHQPTILGRRLELEGRRRDGTIFPLELRVEETVVEATGASFFTAAIRNITERKQAEQALRQSEEKYRTLIDNIQDGAFVIQDGTLRFVNEPFARMVGYATPEMIGMDFLSIVAPEDIPFVADLYAHKTAEEDVATEHEFRVLHRDGATRVLVNVHCGVTTYLGKDATIGTAKDITERKQHEQELLKAQKLESLGLLAGGIAHDFNNVLTAILGLVSVSKARYKLQGNADEETMEILEEMQKASLRAKGLTQQLLTFSKGGAPIKKTANIVSLIEETASFTLHGSQTRCDIRLGDNLQPVDVDKGQLSQVIQNIIINADHAMPEGGVLRISTENIAVDGKDRLPLPPGRYIRISFIDSGTGIKPEQMEKIFDPYFTTKQKGSGLGLSTSYSIIHKHGGHIEVESVLGEGTTFHIYLPASTRAMAKSGYGPKAPPVADIGSGRVLVMDDDEIIRNVLGRMLAELGFDARVTGDGADAVREYRAALEAGKPFNAVILDLTVPGGMGGKKTIEELLHIDPDVRAIVSSGYSNDPVMADYPRYGFKGVIPKPYTLQNIAETLKKVLTETKETHPA